MKSIMRLIGEHVRGEQAYLEMTSRELTEIGIARLRQEIAEEEVGIFFARGEIDGGEKHDAASAVDADVPYLASPALIEGEDEDHKPKGE